MFATVRAGILAALVLVVAGCGSGEARLNKVTGQVTFAGEPVKEGRILFRATGGDQRAYSGAITDGAYEVMCDSGPMRVEVVASRVVPGKYRKGDNGEPDPIPVVEMYIPAKYNSSSTLTAEVKSGANDIPFDLKK